MNIPERMAFTSRHLVSNPRPASDFSLQVNARQLVDLNLQVGQSSQNVTVSDAASLLETDNSSRGQVINPKQIIDLPLNGSAYADLTLLVPGVARSPLEDQSDSSRDASFNINGLRSEYNNFLLDGIDNNSYGILSVSQALLAVIRTAMFTWTISRESWEQPGR